MDIDKQNEYSKLIKKCRDLFGSNIRNFRKLKNLTIEKLAEKCGLSYKYLNKVELGNNNISLDNIIVLSKVLDINLKDFFVFSESDKSNNEKSQQPPSKKVAWRCGQSP